MDVDVVLICMQSVLQVAEQIGSPASRRLAAFERLYYSLAPKRTQNVMSQVNNADDKQESRAKKKNGSGTSNKDVSSDAYCVYYPFDMNNTCRLCHESLGSSMANIEEHLVSHDITKLDYQCGVCHKSWPSWRSVITHYNRSNCRHMTPTILPMNTTATSSVVSISDKQMDVEETDKHITTVPKESNEEQQQENEDKDSQSTLFYCKLCASGGWNKAASLSQHMRRMHAVEYNATIEVPTVKRRWTKDETQVLAEIEASIPSDDGTSINQILSQRFPSRTFEAIKSHRKRAEYRDLVARIRNRGLTTLFEGSTCTDKSSQMSVDNTDNSFSLNPNPVVNDGNIVLNSTNIDDSRPHDCNHQYQLAPTVVNDEEQYPDIRAYIRNNIIVGRIQLCERMRVAVDEFLNKASENSNAVSMSLEGIQEAMKNELASDEVSNRKRDSMSKPKSKKTKKKMQKFAHYQQLFKKNKSKLASEIFDNVDTTANKPPISDAYDHFKQVWEIEASDTATVDEIDTRGADVLLAPITREEIAWVIEHTKHDTAVGPDELTLERIRCIARRELWCAYNIWIGMRKIPEELKINRTALLPKGNEGLDQIKNWRPITIASLLIRLYNKILAKRMQSVFRTSQKQTGFKPMNGVGQNTALLHNILRHARVNRNNLFVCLLDVSKAFDSVPHDSIKRALKRNGCPKDMIELIGEQYENVSTVISYGHECSSRISILRGVKQGDPLSSILFNLVIDELFETIGDRFGYEIPGVGSVNARAFADDIALISGSEIGMQQLLLLTEKFLSCRRLELNVKKCVAICLRKAGKAKKSQIADSTVKNPPVLTIKNEPIRLLGVNEQCKYLGIHYTPLGAVDTRASVSKLRLALTSLMKAPLKPQQKVVMLRMHLIPRFIHTFTYSECYPKLLSQLDRLVRRWLKTALKLPTSLSSDFFYLPIKEGGLGIGKLYDIVGFAKVRLYNMFARSGDVCLQYLVDTQGSSMHARWCQAMKVSYRPPLAELNQRKIVVRDEGRDRFIKTVHGSGHEVFQSSPITNQWLSGQTRIMRGSTFIRSIQMRTNTIPTRVSTSRGRNSVKTCRRCGLADETLIHVLQTCPITHGMRCQRHNNVCRKVADKLRSKGFQVFSEQGIPSPGLQTNISRPDLIAIRAEQGLVLDITCVFESSRNSLTDAYRRKVTRYESLAETIKEKYKIETVQFHGLCIGSRGAIEPRHLSIWHSIGFSGSELSVLAVGVMEDSLRTITLFNNANRIRV